MEIGLEELIKSRKDELVNYSPYSFIKEIKAQDQFDLFVRGEIERFSAIDTCHQLNITIDDTNFVFLYEHLLWDSKYFHRNCYKLYTVLYTGQNAPALIKAILHFKDKLLQTGKCYCFAEIPAEDIFLIQCLNEAGVRLVETRLHYFRKKLEDFTGERYSVRKANLTDIPVLANVAAANRNYFDRLHADYSFSEQEADDYLATYAEAAVHGFCDTVLVPNVPNLPVSSFLAFDHIGKTFPNLRLSLLRVSLAAVASENKGWLLGLLSEVIHHAREHHIAYIEYPTQSANRAAIRTCEKLSFSLGATSYILTFSS